MLPGGSRYAEWEIPARCRVPEIFFFPIAAEYFSAIVAGFSRGFVLGVTEGGGWLFRASRTGWVSRGNNASRGAERAA